MKNIVLFGPPGSGKGTQGVILAHKYDLVNLVMGDILRKEFEAGTEDGIEASTYWLKGNLSPNDIVIRIFESNLKKHIDTCNGFIFDGFPRTVEQAIALDNLMSKFNTKIHHMILLDVDDNILKERILERGKTSNRPDDIDPDIISKRIHVYKNSTYPVAEYYKQQNKLNTINGIGDINVITDNIFEIIK
jgi:adenylate kinase